jgi:hypothetical protein
MISSVLLNPNIQKSSSKDNTFTIKKKLKTINNQEKNSVF